MKKSILTIAALIALIPYEIGISEDWKHFLVTVGGILIILLIIAPRKEKSFFYKMKEGASFVENSPINKDL